MSIDTITTIFLLLLFASAEIYRITRGLPATVIAVENKGSLTSLVHGRIRVRLMNGEETSATMDACTGCMGRIDIGSEVRVLKCRDGYNVFLPWFRVGKRSACAATTTECPSSARRL